MTKIGLILGIGVGIIYMGVFSPTTRASSFSDSEGMDSIKENVLKQTSLSFSPHPVTQTLYTVRNKSSEIMYTLDGHFWPDKRGDLVDGGGNYLQGWKTDENGNIPTGVLVSDLASLTNINVLRVSGHAKATTNIALQVNLPSQDPVGQTRQTVIPFLDSLGAQHNLTITWTKTVITPATWTYPITCPDVPNANIKRASSGRLYNGTSSPTVVFNHNGSPDIFDGDAAPEDVVIEWDNTITNAADTRIALDFGTVGSNTGVTSLAGDFSAPTIDQDGREFGTFRSVSADEDGIISATYSNGQELKIARVAFSKFYTPSGCLMCKRTK